MKDILDRLRYWRKQPVTADLIGTQDQPLRATLVDACDEITKLREALKPFAKLADTGAVQGCYASCTPMKIAGLTKLILVEPEAFINAAEVLAAGRLGE